MVLLSPSRTIGESLTTLASSTAQQLEEVWDEVGYSPEDRASQLSDLLVKFRDLCDAKIAEEQGVAQTFRNTIEDAKKELEATGEALKMLVDPHLLRESSGLTLQDELDGLEAELAGIRESAASARKELEDYRETILDAHKALGLGMAEKWNDVSSDLTMERREEFQRKAIEMKEELNSRTSAVISLLQGCQELMNELSIGDEGSLLDRRIAGSLVRSKDGSLMMASKLETDTCVGIGATVTESLVKRTAELSKEKSRRKVKLQEMGEEISSLWDKLRIPIEDQSAFSKSVQGLHLDTIAKGQAEIDRLHAIKNKMMGELIVEARETIASLWRETNATDEQRKAFEHFFVANEEMFNDELLEKHEEYLGVLEGQLEQMKPILRLIERREEIVKERMEYEKLQKDSERLQKRGAEMTKQLMREEKMAKRIKRELPKLTALLDDKLQEWKEEHGEPFLHNGRSYLDVMKDQDVDWKRYKAEEAQQKRKKKQDERAQVENRYRSAKATNGKKLPASSSNQKTRVFADRNAPRIR